MTVLCVDTETTISNNGSPFDPRNELVCFSWADSTGSGASQATESNLAELADRIKRCRIFVGFNCQFDIHWLRRVGIRLPEECRVADCQLAEFVLTNQQQRYPSLEDSLVKYDLGHKIDTVKNDYWSKKINTNEIPWEVLGPYAEQDAVMTLKLYEHQVSLMTREKHRLWNLMNMDLLILEDMTYNGIRFNEELCETRSTEIKEQIQGITKGLSAIYPNVPINFSSGDHVSSFLYGGTINEETKEHDGFFKTGLRAGQPKYKNVIVAHELPRLVEPLRGSELKKQGFYQTNADTLLKLKANKATRHIVSLIQQQVRLETLLSKTYDGLIKKRIEQQWEPGWLHGQFNQVTVATGRLSSSGPNLQNLDSAANDLFISRYDH